MTESSVVNLCSSCANKNGSSPLSNILGNQVYDPNNLFDGQSYAVPYTGLYNVKGSIALQMTLLGAYPTRLRTFQVMVRRFDSSAALLQTTLGAVSQAVRGGVDMYSSS